jgi:hypothetical protein
VNDPRTGTRIRLGEVGHELAQTLAEQGNLQAARQALSKPHVGVWFSKTF